MNTLVFNNRVQPDTVIVINVSLMTNVTCATLNTRPQASNAPSGSVYRVLHKESL
jgi:hypothetical protein